VTGVQTCALPISQLTLIQQAGEANYLAQQIREDEA